MKVRAILLAIGCLSCTTAMANEGDTKVKGTPVDAFQLPN
jgi:hypothetical protein